MLLVRAALFRDRVESRSDEIQIRALSAAESASERRDPESIEFEPNERPGARHPDGTDEHARR